MVLKEKIAVPEEVKNRWRSASGFVKLRKLLGTRDPEETNMKLSQQTAEGARRPAELEGLKAAGESGQNRKLAWPRSRLAGCPKMNPIVVVQPSGGGMTGDGDDAVRASGGAPRSSALGNRDLPRMPRPCS